MTVRFLHILYFLLNLSLNLALALACLALFISTSIFKYAYTLSLCIHPYSIYILTLLYFSVDIGVESTILIYKITASARAPHNIYMASNPAPGGLQPSFYRIYDGEFFTIVKRENDILFVKCETCGPESTALRSSAKSNGNILKHIKVCCLFAESFLILYFDAHLLHTAEAPGTAESHP